MVRLLCDDATDTPLAKGNQVVTNTNEVGRLVSCMPEFDCVVLKFGDGNTRIEDVHSIGAHYSDDCAA